MFRPTPMLFGVNALAYDYNPKAPEPLAWLAFLDQLWPEDRAAIELLQDWFGYILTADTSLQKMLLIVGPPRSGKGTIARILSAVIGSANVCGPTLGSLATNFGLWPIIGKQLAIISDARLSGRTDQAIVTERLLSISGEDAVTIDRKNMVPLTIQLAARFMILTNELPRLSDSSGALANRFVVLTMDQSFLGKEDTGLTTRLMNELPGILLWAIAGWHRLKARGRFIQPETSSEAISDMMDLASPVSAFVKDRCDVSPGRSITPERLYLAWGQWCTTQGRKEPGILQGFCRDLRAAVPGLSIKQRREPAGGRTRIYEGIDLVD